MLIDSFALGELKIRKIFNKSVFESNFEIIRLKLSSISTNQ